eukprot:Em0019g424a
MRAYYAILGVGSIGFSSLQAIATFSMLNQYISPTLIPMNVSQIDVFLSRVMRGQEEEEEREIRGTGTSGWHDRCTIKWATFNRTYGDTSYHLIQILQSQENETGIDYRPLYYQEQPLSKLDSFIRSLPASEPIYEHISDCHDQPQSKADHDNGENKGCIRAFKSTSCIQHK